MPNALRMLDANANRAREAARVLEDVARFILNRADLAECLKALRHSTADAALLAAPDATLRLASRDTPGDVGTTISAPGEYLRTDASGLIAANAARLQEALRSLEETSKLLSRPDAAKALESARYAAYDLERDLQLALGGRARRQWRLCVLLTESLCAHPWLDVARAAIDGGADCLQLREKTLDSGELLARAKALVTLARPRSVSVIINDRPDIAAIADADGAHLGQTDLGVADARRVVGSRLIGVSTTNVADASRARTDGADYIGLGPMFPTTTKHKDLLAGPAYVRDVLSNPAIAPLPHLVIGGIDPSNVAQLGESGARGVAVSSCVCRAADPAAVCAALLAGLRKPE